MLLAPIYARLLTMVEYGFNSTIGTWNSLLGMVVTGELTGSIYRAHYEFPGQLDAYNSSIAFLGSLITLTFYAIALIFSDFVCNLFGCGIEYIHLMFGVLLISPALGIWQSKHRLCNQYRIIVTITVVSWVISAAVNILMLVSTPFRMAIMGRFGNDRIFSMMVGSAIPGFLLNLVVYGMLIFRGRKLVNLKYWRFALAMSLPLIPHMLAGSILNHSDRLMITSICGEEYTALYSITYTCSAIISMVFNSLNQAWVPWFNDCFFHKRDSQVKQATLIYNILFFLITLGGIAIGPELLRIVGGEKYMPALSMMPIVMVSCFFQFTNGFFVNVEVFEKKTYITALGTTIAALLNVGLNFWLIPLYGYQVGALTTLIGFLFLFVYHSTICRFLLKKRLTELYPMRLMLLLCACMLALIYPANWLYGYTVPRYLVIALGLAAFAGYLLKNWKTILSMLRMSKRRKGQSEQGDETQAQQPEG